MKMKACENHTASIVIFNSNVCPFCKMEEKLKTIREEVEKSMVIMRQIQTAAEEAGLKCE